MDDFIAFLVISASFILAALVSAKKNKTGQAQKPQSIPTPAAPHREERQRHAAEERQKEVEDVRRRAREAADESIRRREEYERRARESRAAKESLKARNAQMEAEARMNAEAQMRITGEGRPSEEIADAMAHEAESAAAAAAAERKGNLSFDPEEMVIYSEVLAPKFEEY